MRRWFLSAAALVAAAAALATPGIASAAGPSISPDVVRTPRAHATSAQANLPYGGGPVLHSNRTHLIFWQPGGSGLAFDAGYIPLVERFMAQVALGSHTAGNVYGISGEYRDAVGPAAYASRYGGAVLDTNPLPTSGCVEPPVAGPGWTDCVSDDQLQSEILKVIGSHHLPTGSGEIYFMITPNGLGSCESTGPDDCALGGDTSGSYCGYHSNTPDGEVLYAVIPYNAVSGHCQSGNPRPNASTADPTLSTLSHEHIEVITDPVGTSWLDGQGNETGDLCITTFGPDLGGAGGLAWNQVIAGGHYYLQDEWSNRAHGCRARAAAPRASLSARRARLARTESFQGRGSLAGGSIVAFTWSFGDGVAGRGRRVTHRYRRGGRYQVKLRVTDSAGNYAYAASSIVVRRG